jgi:hypothetical protein
MVRALPLARLGLVGLGFTFEGTGGDGVEVVEGGEVLLGVGGSC